MRIALILGLAIFALAWLQATAFALNSLGVEIGASKAANVYSGWVGLGVATVAAIALLYTNFRTRSETT